MILKNSFTVHSLLLTFGLLYCFNTVSGHGCIPKICDKNEENEFKKCVGASSKNCGAYASERWENRIVMGVDIDCEVQGKVFAPFNGTVRYYTPFGDGSCIDKGVKIEGEGEWQGYFATIAYMQPYRTSGKVHQGQLIGRAVNIRECRTNDEEVAGNHVLFQMYRYGRVVDPTSHLQKCMCTGRTCQTNPKNSFNGDPYKSHDQFGIGFELACPDVADPPEDSTDPSPHVPLVYSPIDGSRLGRIRLRDPKDHPGDCTNDGIFIIGDGKWKDYTVRIYNARFDKSKKPGELAIAQGDPIARRLDCDGSAQSIFLEFRHLGKLVNVTNQINGDQCHVPDNS